MTTGNAKADHALLKVLLAIIVYLLKHKKGGEALAPH
jgi:hypothetical protein